MNLSTIIGRLVRDPEMKYLTTGTAVTRMTVAVDRQMPKDKKEEAKRNNQPTADFIPVTVWGKSAENCANYLAKGSQVAVQGRITTGSYEKDGKKVYTTEVTANNVQFLDSKNSAPKQDSGVDGFDLADEISSEDIPF